MTKSRTWRPPRWRMKNRAGFSATALALLLGGAAAGASAETGFTTAKITYLTSTTVYIDAGSDSGLREGMTVEILRDGKVVAEMPVTAVSSRRASCARGDSSLALALGQRVRFRVSRARPKTTPSGPSSRPEPVPTGRSRLHITDWFRDRNIRGRVGIRYFGLHDGTEFGQDFYQPALDIRLDGTGVGNPDVNLSVDVRTRRTFRNPPDGGVTSEGRMRVYRMYGEWNRRGTGLRAVAGRHYSSALSSISVFDGVTVEYGRGHWSAGGFTGTQPDPEDFGFSTAIREHGAYFTWKSGPSSWSRWQATGGLVGSYEEGTVNREFLVLQGRYFAKDVSASLIQEIDINRGWKQDAGESMLSFTSTFLTGRYQVSERLSVDGGFDTRRSIRLYRDRVTPETEFDDSYRRGYWAGVQHRPLRNTRLGLTVRRSAGGSSGSANSATLTAGSGWPAFHDLSGKIRSTWYRNDHVGGWLRSVSGGFAVGARIHTELTVGDRHETARDELARKTDLFWVSLDLDYRISRPWYLLASLERNQGDLEENTQVFGSALYRF